MPIGKVPFLEQKKEKERKTSCLEFITLPAIAMSSFQRKS